MGDPVPGANVNPDAGSVRAELARVLASDVFCNAPILSRFLRYVVEQRIDGIETSPKEYTIGVDVFERGAGFDPRVDTIVRVHARRLRKRLKDYYEHAGRDDPLKITIPKGHYQAEIAAQPVVSQTLGWPQVRTEPGDPDPIIGRKRFRSNAIPAPRTPLVGRSGEVAELHDMLTEDDGPRLVTLTGTAGSGKTRLAVEAGLRWQATSSREAVFVRLASITDAPTLQLALLRVFGLRAADDTSPPLEVLCNYLHGLGQAPPLILDNFEQLAGEASLIGALLDACISLRILVTSRVALHLYGECEYPVLPLALPDRDSMMLEDLAAVPAVQLFVQRAAAVRPGFSLGADNAEAVARICRRFEGLPLGIELAAAQCRTLTPAQLLERFPDRLDLAAANTADVPERQRTLRRAIEWSHALLGEPERKLFRRLSVFSGGFTLEAAEAVADVHGDLGLAADEALARLCDNNLVETASDADEPRYAMLETIRECGLEQLAASGEGDAIGKAHAAYFLVLAEEGLVRLDGKARHHWLRRCDLERDNFRSALGHLMERGDGQWALRLVRALYRYWEAREYLAEACAALLPVLERFEPAVAPALWAQIACCAGAMESRMGQQEVAHARLARGLAVARESGDRSMLIMALTSLAVSHGALGQNEEAVALFEECLALCESPGSASETAWALSNLAVARLTLGEHDRARNLLERALELFRKQQEWTPAAWCLNQLGDVATVAGRHDEAKTWYQRSAEQFVKLGDFLGIARCWTDLGQLALEQGQHAEAASLFADALRVYRKKGFQRGVANLIEGCVGLAVARKRYPQALVLAGAAEAVRSTREMVATPQRRARFEEALRPAHDALTRAEIVECRRRGATMDVVQAIGYV
ncbi:MAG TPA: tetratricopeptide repeat protein [Rhodanobacteraceae bacterium]|nr:tetratricopeptide repeat protein [Rhodanobacteraceae bacterium]